MSIQAKSLIRTALVGLFVVAAAAPLAAQLDTRLQTTPSDFLDLWQGVGTNVGGVKPEILMILDASLSTARMMFHPLYPNNWQDEQPPNNPDAANSTDYSCAIAFSGSLPSSPSTAVPTWIVGFTASETGAPTSGTTGGGVPASGTTYYIGGTRAQSTAGALNYYNTLIRPDGAEVTVADVTASGGSTSSLLAWLKCASHVRMRLNKVGTSTTGTDIGRIVDFPLSWQPMDAPASGTYTTPTGGVARAKAYDPVGSAYLDFDTTAIGTSDSTTGYAYATSTGAWITGGGGASGDVRTRYIEWLWVGKDPNSTGGASYCIPNAVDDGTAAHLNAVNPAIPAGIAYNGPSYSWQVQSYITTPQPAFANGISNRIRAMSIKEGVIKTWLNYQNNVLLAYRFLSDTGQTPSQTLQANTDSTSHPAAVDSTNWTYMDPANKTTLVATLAGTDWSGGAAGTWLSESLLSGYCQMTNPQAFSGLITSNAYTSTQLQCMKHYVILLTDGAPSTYSPSTYETRNTYTSTTTVTGANSAVINVGGQLINFPYDPGSATGNAIVFAHPGWLTGTSTSSTFWNCPTLAGIAAHGGDGSSTNKTWIADPSANPLTGSLTSLTTTAGWMPFWVKQRNNGGSSLVTLSPAQPIQTMTVGVSLGVDFVTAAGGTTLISGSTAPTLNTPAMPIAVDTTGSKFRLLAAACYGDPGSTAYDLGNSTANNSVPYYRDTTTGNKAPSATYFFDGRDPSTLVQNLDNAFEDIKNNSNVSTTATPVIPFVGQGLGQEIYITKFVPSQIATKPIWNGDLRMFPTQQSGDTLQVLDVNGVAITNLDDPNHPPAWSANTALYSNRNWSLRHIYTRLAGTSALTAFSPLDDASGWAPSGAYSAIKAAVATGVTGTGADITKQKIIAWLMGADTSTLVTGTSPSTSTPNRSVASTEGDLVGDIINSTPTAVEYTLTSTISAALPTKLSTQVSNAARASATPHFRVLFVGTGRGFLHAFGEVSYTQVTTTAGVTTKIVKGDVDELWSFVPTDFLAKLDQISPTASHVHRYAVDGDPYVWFLDLPASGASVGNDKIDYDATVGSTDSEKAMLVFGLRKGGRSYYALNIQNPFTPTLGWALVPDEWASGTSTTAATFLDSAVASTVTGSTLRPIVQNMGFSSCQPAVGRVELGPSTNVQVRDALFLGGGYSTPEVESAFNSTTPPSLGRSALALDVQTGKVLAAWSFPSSLNMGPVSAGLVPVEFFLNSGFVQRAYFTDYKGGLWALGSAATNASGTYASFRRDSNALDHWTTDGNAGSALAVRHVYQDSGNSWRSTAGADNAIISMRPAPFLIGSYPGLASWTVSGNTVTTYPAAMGIALVTGDRDNPLDKNYLTGPPATIPNQHKLTVVFDRQDSARSGLGLTSGLITDTNLSNFTAQTSAPASTYWNDSGTSTKFGYYLNFPASSVSSTDGNTYVPKGIYEPIILDRVLFYSYFTPNARTCAGGGGNTYTNEICDVLFPAFPGNGTAAATTAGCQSGMVATWTGVSSPLGVLSTAAAIQAGITNFSTTTNGVTTISPGIGIKVLKGQLHELYPKVRTWRTVR